MMNSMFLDEAVRIGRFLTGTAIRHAGRCTWLDDDAIAHNGWWSWKSGTLGATFGAGTAGVGWFMARLSSIVQDRTLATISTEALRQSLQTADDLLANRKLGFQDGALGLAWALVDVGRSLQCDEFLDKGIQMGLCAADLVESDPNSIELQGLWRGYAGILSSLLTLADISEEPEFMKPVRRIVEGILTQVSQANRSSRSFVGLAEGASGIGVMLADWSKRTGDIRARDAAIDMFRIERPWCGISAGWSGAPAHAWADETLLERSLCSGAAGIGIARLKAHAIIPSLNLLAEAGAAIELVRRRPIDAEGADLSLCHGAAGEIELLTTAFTTLREQSHLEAARRSGARLIATARASRAYDPDSGESVQGPSFQFGLSGLGLVLLRLQDPALAQFPPMLL